MMNQDVSTGPWQKQETDALVHRKTAGTAEPGTSTPTPRTLLVVSPPEAGHGGDPSRGDLARERLRAVVSRLRHAGAFVASRLRSAWSHRAVRIAALAVALALPVPAAVVLSHVYFDRSGLPDLEPFLRFEPLTIGTIYDSQGEPLIELAREHRRIISYDEIPLILRQAILAAEDKNYFSHSGVDYWALPRVVQKMAVRSWGAWRQDGASFRLMLPQGGSTLTQQLVRGYFLQERTSAENGDSLFRERSLHDEREPLRDDKKARTILRSESFSLRTMIRKNCSDVNALSH